RSAESCCRQALTRFTVLRCAGPDRRARRQAPPDTIAPDRVALEAHIPRRGARAAESARLEIVCPSRDRGFKSHPLRQVVLFRTSRGEKPGERRASVLASWRNLDRCPERGYSAPTLCLHTWSDWPRHSICGRVNWSMSCEVPSRSTSRFS